MSLPPDWKKEMAILKGLIVKRFPRISVDPFGTANSLSAEALYTMFPKIKKVEEDSISLTYDEHLAIDGMRASIRYILKDIF
jgi:hypothetical protein